MKSQKELFDEFLSKLEQGANESKKVLKLPLIPDQKTGKLLWFSNRELRLRYLINVDSNKEFFEGLMKGELLTTKCKNCSKIYFPPQNYCYVCNKTEMEWIKLSGEGELLSFIQVNVKPYSFSHLDDYTIGIARLKEGINILAWVAEKDVSKLKRGMKVKIRVVERPQEGYLTYEIFPD